MRLVTGFELQDNLQPEAASCASPRDPWRRVGARLRRQGDESHPSRRRRSEPATAKRSKRKRARTCEITRPRPNLTHHTTPREAPFVAAGPRALLPHAGDALLLRRSALPGFLVGVAGRSGSAAAGRGRRASRRRAAAGAARRRARSAMTKWKLSSKPSTIPGRLRGRQWWHRSCVRVSASAMRLRCTRHVRASSAAPRAAPHGIGAGD